MSTPGQFYQWFKQAVSRGGTTRTVYSPDTTLSRRGLLERADRRARELKSIGIRPRDVVVVSLGNITEFLVLLVAISKLGAVSMPIDPANGDRALLRGLSRISIRSVLRRPRGMENAPLVYPEDYRLISRRKLAGTLLSIDLLSPPDRGPYQNLLDDTELIMEAPSNDECTRDVFRSGNTLRSIGTAAFELLELDHKTKLLCSESLTVPRFFDPVILGWMASDCSLVMAEDPTLHEALSLTRETDRIIAVDSLRNFAELARNLRTIGSQRPLIPVVSQIAVSTQTIQLLTRAFGNTPLQLLQLEELGLLAVRTLQRNKPFQIPSHVDLKPGKSEPSGRSECEILVSSEQIGQIYPPPEPGQPGTKSDGEKVHSGYLGKFSRKGLSEILGRNDRLVNLEGRRASLATIESAMLKHRRITWACAKIQRDEDAPFLCLEYKATGETELEDIEEHAVGNLLPYMVPRRFIRIQATENNDVK